MDPPEYDLFISFRGEDVRVGLLSFLVNALQMTTINFFVDYKATRGEVLDSLFTAVRNSRIVLVIISEKFIDSTWCVNEVDEAIETRGPGKTIIPVFYKVSVEEVKKQWSFLQKGERKITDFFGLQSSDYPANESDFVNKIVEEVQKTLKKLKEEKQENRNTMITTPTPPPTTPTSNNTTMPFFGVKLRVQQLHEKLKMDHYEETRVVGVVGMRGIGKTKLAEMLFEVRRDEFDRSIFFPKVNRKKDGNKLDWLLNQFLRTILNIKEKVTIIKHEYVKEKLLEAKCLIVFDDFSDKEELKHLLGDKTWIRQGSKIVIVTSDKSIVEGLVDDTYVVPGLDENEGLECLNYHAFKDTKRCSSEEGQYLTISRKFVEYAKGNPTALTLLGKQLWKRDVCVWETILRTLETSPDKNIQDLLNSCFASLTEPQQEAFLDITCFFRSQDYNFVKMVVDSSCATIIKDLADKFLIQISGDRVEMNGLLYKLGKNLVLQEKKNLASQDKDLRLWNQQDIIQALEDKMSRVFPGERVRGIFLDLCGIEKKPLQEKAFEDMKNLRYLKIYNSRTYIPESDGNLIIRNGLQFTLEEVRYLHWLKFPLEKLPKDFSPKNLINLKLPYSNIKQLWDGGKEVKNLKWVDLNHSVNLEDLSGLAGARNLQRLSLEGCTGLTMLEEEIMQTMTSLVFLNLRSCTSLESLPEINIKSLKTLILTECSNLDKFQMISENLEALYLDGTAVKRLPESTIMLQKLIVLNMKDCKMLASVPDSLVKLQSLQEVILSGCSRLKSFPDINECMKRLRILLLDGTAINQVPQVFPSGMNGLSLLRRLCMSRNGVIQNLQPYIGQLYHLKCLELKYCKKLTSIPTLPPNLQCLNAHGCESLTTVGNPLAFHNLTDQVHSKFIFSNCNNLDDASKSCIISYIHKKSQFISCALNRYNLGSCVEHYTGACFPGCEVPEWFSYQDYGPKIETDLARNWSENRVIGIALCVAVSFQDYMNQNSGFFVKCTCEFKNSDESFTRFSCTVGGSTGPWIESREIKSDHVFVRYTSLLQIKELSKAEEMRVCSSTKATFIFEVVDGADKAMKCKVLKCGFSMMYEPEDTEHDHVSWEVNSDGSPMVDDNIHDVESVQSATQEADEISIDEKGSDDDEGHQQRQNSCISLEHNATFETENDSDQSTDDEETQRNFGAEALTKIQPEFKSGLDENYNGEAKIESTPTIQESHVPQVGARNNEFINGEGDTTCFSFLHGLIPCLRRKQLEVKSQTRQV